MESKKSLRETLLRYLREPMSALTHVIALVLAVIGLIVLVVETLNVPDRLVSVAVYGVALVAMFAASTALHATHGDGKTLAWLARLDHAAIYLLIAGSYTPICYNLLDGFWQWGMLTIVWGIALVGIALKLSVFDGGQSNWLSTASYLVMGWLAVLAFPHLVTTLPWQATLLIVLGGLAYSAGVYFFVVGQKLELKPIPKPFFGYHEWWHLFVMVGSLVHFLAVWRYVAAA